MCLAHYSPDYCFSPAITEKNPVNTFVNDFLPISWQTHIRFNIPHPQSAPSSPRLHLLSLRVFLNVHPNKSKHTRPTDKELKLLKTGSKSKQSKTGKQNPHPSCDRPAEVKTSMLHRPNRNESRNHAKLSSWPLANLLPRLEPDAEAVIASCLRQKSCCSGARCCLNNTCLPKRVPVCTHTTPKQARDVCAMMTGPKVNISCYVQSHWGGRVALYR